MYIISVEKIKIDALIGVYEIEKKEVNTFLIDVHIETDFLEAMMSDTLKDTIDYGKIYEIVLEQMSIPCDLLERKAFDIAKMIFKHFEKANSLRLKIIKLSPLNMPLCENASIEWKVKREIFSDLWSIEA